MDPAVQESAPAAEVAPPPAQAATGARPPPAATDLYPRDAEERKLCDKASTPDWLYMAIPPVLVAGAIVLDSQGLKYQENAFLRTLGPASVGLTWGFMVGGVHDWSSDTDWPELRHIADWSAATLGEFEI